MHSRQRLREGTFKTGLVIFNTKLTDSRCYLVAKIEKKTIELLLERLKAVLKVYKSMGWPSTEYQKLIHKVFTELIKQLNLIKLS